MRFAPPIQVRFAFAAEAEPVAATELVGLKLDPAFRVSQIEGLADESM